MMVSPGLFLVLTLFSLQQQQNNNLVSASEVEVKQDDAQPCIDTAKQGTKECQRWAAMGECKENPGFMHNNCKKTCGLCGDAPPIDHESICQDIAENGEKECRQWAWHGECDTNPEFMHKQCKKSCGLCESNVLEPVNCVDDLSRCEEWAGKGYCVGTWKAMLGDNEVDSAYVAEFCPKSCEICDIYLDSRDLDLGIGLPQTAPDIDDKAVRNKVRAQVAETRKYIQSLDPDIQEACKMSYPLCSRFALSTDCKDNEDHDMMKYMCAASCKTCERFFDEEERAKAERGWELALAEYRNKEGSTYAAYTGEAYQNDEGEVTKDIEINVEGETKDTKPVEADNQDIKEA